MEWTIKLEARSGWGEGETIEVGRLKRRIVGLTADEVGLTLAEGKDLLSELQRLVFQTQTEEYIMCARVCRECLTLRRQRDCRTRTIQALFGTVEVDSPRISVCPCLNEMGFVDLSSSPLAQLLGCVRQCAQKLWQANQRCFFVWLNGAVSSSRPEILTAMGGAAVKDGRQAAALAARSVLEGGSTYRHP
jgi:hypothetical protein